jgi:hypothetical protein
MLALVGEVGIDMSRVKHKQSAAQNQQANYQYSKQNLLT